MSHKSVNTTEVKQIFHILIFQNLPNSMANIVFNQFDLDIISCEIKGVVESISKGGGGAAVSCSLNGPLLGGVGFGFWMVG